jgi:hypothetical protein
MDAKHEPLSPLALWILQAQRDIQASRAQGQARTQPST